MMAVFREGIGETPYPKWEDLDQPTIDLYLGAIDLVQSYEYHSVTPNRIHQYWHEWAKTHRPNHNSLIPFDQLSPTEKIKDQLVVSIISAIKEFSEIS